MAVGYKVLDIRLRDTGEPALVSPVQHYCWPSSRLLESDWTPEVGDFLSSARGIYSVKELSDLRIYYEPNAPNVIAELIPVGKTVHGEKGYRSEKALLNAVYWDPVHTCSLCRKDVWELNLVGNLTFTGFICPYCAPEEKRYKWDEVIYKISRKYDVPVIKKVGLLRRVKG